MTARAVLIGFACASFLCGAFYFNNYIIRQSNLIRHFLPISVYGGLMLFVILVNPVLHRLRLALSGREVAVAVAVMLAACYVPGFSLTQTMAPVLMLPHHYAKTDPGWREAGVIKAVPKHMLADPGVNEGEALNGYLLGLAEGDEHIPLRRVPWRAWTRTLAFWFPVIMTLAVLSIAIALVVHRQWSEHERLPYPIVAFAHSVLPGEDGSANPILRNRLFWIGLGVPALIHLNNYAFKWFPTTMVQMPLVLNFRSLEQCFPLLTAGHGWIMFRPKIIFAVIGFAFFLASDVSFSLGIAPFVYCAVIGVFAGYGVVIADAAFISQGLEGYAHAGAFFGVFLALLYTGRHHYLSALRRAVGLSTRDEMRPAEVWGVRVGAVAFGLLIVQFTSTGLDWQLAFLYVSIAVMVLTVLSRIVAETGVFFVFPMVYPCALLLGFIGMRGMGFTTMAVLYTITSVILLLPSEALMPFVVQANRLVGLTGGKVGRLAVACAFVVAIGFAVAFPLQLYWQYDRGAQATGHWWTTGHAPRLGPNEAVRIKRRLEAQGMPEQAEAVSGWGRFARASPDGTRIAAFGLILTLVLLCAWARMRFPRWPLHPVFFLLGGTYPSRVLAFSFLAGCLVKALVRRYGGATAVRKAKPLMVGLIAGEMLSGVAFILVGAVYYFVTGRPPVGYRVIPI
ncbi:MAG: DUF6785 family protein [Planctomycetota bacterium]